MTKFSCLHALFRAETGIPLGVALGDVLLGLGHHFVTLELGLGTS